MKPLFIELTEITRGAPTSIIVNVNAIISCGKHPENPLNTTVYLNVPITEKPVAIGVKETPREILRLIDEAQ